MAWLEVFPTREREKLLTKTKQENPTKAIHDETPDLMESKHLRPPGHHLMELTVGLFKTNS